jgi:hypothetical protein
MSKDVVAYLNPLRFYSKVRDQIEACKMAKMPPAQWITYINGLSGKGVKLVEIEDMKIIPWLTDYKEKSLTKEELLRQVDRMGVTVKEVVLGSPKYRGYSHADGKDIYQECLYIANSESANFADRIEEIEFEMEEINFNLEKLYEDPGLAGRLEAERRELFKLKPTAIDFESHHFSDRIKGRHGKNLLLHARIIIRDKPNGKKLFFIDEIQSDWGQQGRVRKRSKDAYMAPGETVQWKDLTGEQQEAHRAAGNAPPSWNKHVPHGPWVTDTKLWAGLGVRRLLQRAAAISDVDEVSWIRLCMRNGGKTDPRQEDARLQAARAEQANQEGHDDDSDEEETDHYYRRLIPKLAEAALGKSGVKVTYDNVVRLGDREYGGLPGFKMTDAARQALSAKQPLYSAANVIRNPMPVPDEKLDALLRHGRGMLGSAAKIRFAASLFDFQEMSYKSGSYMNKLVQVALNGHDLERALNHEAYHCAHELFLSQSEKNAMTVAFRRGSELNDSVVTKLLEIGEVAAAKQCNNAEEAAAHAFSLWNRGQFKLPYEGDDVKPQGVFQNVKSALVGVVKWISGESLERGINTPEKVFIALSNGTLFKRHEQQQIDLSQELEQNRREIQRTQRTG